MTDHTAHRTAQSVMPHSIVTEFRRQRTTAERSLAQVSDEALNRVPFVDGNSIAMQVRHVTGNLISRFTNFLSEDGEKPWRNRDAEFEERLYTRSEVDVMWREAWRVFDETVATLTDEDIRRTVQIRGESLTAEAALLRSLAHLAYHVGQIVLLARLERGESWEWITIPKGQSAQYNAALRPAEGNP